MTTLQTAIPRGGIGRARHRVRRSELRLLFNRRCASIKLASGRFSVFQIAFTVALFALLPVMALTRGQGGLRALVPHRWHLVALRGVLTAVGSLLAWRAFACCRWPRPTRSCSRPRCW